MKTKLSKRILSVFLAVLMMVTSVPMAAVTAFADNSGTVITDAYIEAAKKQMSNFKEKLETPNASYKKVTDAYNAYVGCQEALDAYIYGGASVSILTQATDNLKTAIAGIEEYTGDAAINAVNEKDRTDYSRVWAGDSSDLPLKNILWSETNYSAERGAANGIDGKGDNAPNVKTIIYYPEVTMLYDGKNIPQATIRVTATGDGNAKDKTRYVTAIELNNTDGIILDDNWKGFDGGNFDVAWALNYGTDSISYTDTQNGAKVYQVYDCDKWLWSSPTITPRNASNFIKFTGTLANNELYRDITPSVSAAYGSSGGFIQVGGDITSTVEGNQKIHVVNFKALIDAVAANGSKMKTIDVSNYTQGGLSYYIKAMDDATAFNPLDWFTTSNNYTGCASEISRLISVMENADTTKTNDPAYDNLRKAMDAKMGDYNKGVQPEDSTDASWTELKSAYEDAMAVMAGLTTTGYNDPAGAQAAADRLAACNLEFAVSKIDTTELEAVIDALFSYESIFVPELRAEANAAAAAAQTAVWGSVDNYPNTKDSLSDTPENQEIYANALENVKTAVKALRFSPDKFTMTSHGRFSLNSAIELLDTIEDPTDYNNYADLALAVEQAKIYLSTINDVELTDYPTQMENHRYVIEVVVSAYNDLEYTFTKIPDGTVARVGGRTEMTPLTTKDTYNFQGQFSYTNSAVIIRTTCDAISVPWGRATVGVSSDCTNSNSGLDSITINPTMPKMPNGGQGGHNRIVQTNNNSSTPIALDDQQKSDYSGCLTNGNFEFKNIKYSGRSHNNVASQAFVASDGTKVSAADAENIILDEMLTKTDGTATNPAWGCVTVSPASKETAWAYVSGDLVLNGPQFDKPTLSVATTPVKRTYTLDTNFAMVGLFNTQNGWLNYSYYQWLTSESSGEKIHATVEVVDISTLVDLVAECNLISEPAKYTEDSYSRFSTALKEAGSDIDYSNLTADRITEICESRYTNLWSAYNGLKLKTYTVQFKYMTVDGTEKTVTITPTHGDAVSSKPVYLNNFNKINLVDYVDGNYTMQPIGWSPAFDIDAPITSDITYVAQYEAVLNVADFTAFNTAKNALVNALVDNKFTASSLKAAAAELAKLVYFDEAAQADVMADKQADIDAETAVLEAQLAALKAVDYDKSVADAVKEQIALAQKTDPDMYDSSVTLDNEEVVSICGKDVVGLVFETQADLDKAIADAVNEMTPITYDIYLNGVKIGTGVYGEAVVINSDGVLYNNVEDHDTDTLDGEGWAAWNYHYKANTSESVDKYMFTAKAIGFIVRGDAYVTSTPADAPDSNYLVTIKDANSDKVLLAEVSDGEYTLPKAPARPYYNFVNYVVDGVAYNVGDVITLTANTTVEAVYAAKEENTFEISFAIGSDSFNDGEYVETRSGLRYDEVVTFEAENAYAWAFAKQDLDWNTEYTVIHYGPSYSFNVYQSMTDVENEYFAALVALTLDDYNRLQETDADYNELNKLITPDGVQITPVSGNIYTGYVYSEAKPFVAAHNVPVPKYSESNVEKFTLIGFTAAPAGYTVVEHGFLFTRNADVSSMTVEDVDMKNVVRMKSSNTTVGDQFVVDIKNPAASVSFKYSAYAVIKDAEGNTSYIYSNIIDGTNNF